MPVRAILKDMGEYQILQVIGAGGMGTVFKAKELTQFPRVVAMKKFDGAILGKAFETALENETSISLSVQHPNIITTLDYGWSGPDFYTVMEFLDGIPLSAVLRHFSSKKKTIDESDVANIALQVASALDYLHTHNPKIIHRDISPDNLFITSSGHVKLIDFGVSISNDQVDDSAAGKPRYFSPEQARNEKLDERSDLFSLGVVLYEALTCERLYSPRQYSDISACETIASVPPDLSRLRNLCSGPMESIVNRCLEFNLLQRYDSARTLSTALTAMCRQSGLVSAPDQLRQLLQSVPKEASASRMEVGPASHRIILSRSRLEFSNREIAKAQLAYVDSELVSSQSDQDDSRFAPPQEEQYQLEVEQPQKPEAAVEKKKRGLLSRILKKQ